MMASALMALAFSVGAAPLYESELIFPFNEFHNHGSSIVETPEGDLLACWFHGSGERNSDDVLVQGARRRKGEPAWGEPFLMADTPNLPDCNPVLFVDPRGTLWLFWITVQNNEWGGSLLKYRTSTDYSADGPPRWDWQDVIHVRPTNLEPKVLAALDEAQAQLGEAIEQEHRVQRFLDGLREAASDRLTQRLGWMTRIHPIMTSEDRLMLGLYSDVWNCSLAAFTEDWGKNWTFSEPIITHQFGNIQPAFVRKKDGTIVAFMRDNGLPKKIRRAESKDDGMTWSEVTTLDIPNPGSSVDACALDNGHWVLVCNDQPQGRHRLTVYLSEDEGDTWPVSRPLEDFPPEKGSASYPSMMQAGDGSIHCTYSFRDEATPGSTIKHARCNEDWIRQGQP